jgi:hypothetical protein
MFQTIMKLYDAAAATAATSVKGKYIYFGASIIYCDEKNVCAVYYPDTSAISASSVSSTSSDVKSVVSSS